MDTEAGQSDIIMKTTNELMKLLGHHPDELDLQKKDGVIASKDTTENDPATLPHMNSDSFHLPGEENASFLLSNENTRPRQQLPREAVRILPGAVRVQGIIRPDHWQETLLDESEDPRDSLSGYQILNNDDEESHVNDGLCVVPEAELVELTQTELESRVAVLGSFFEKLHQPWTLKRIAIWVVVFGIIVGLIVIIVLVAELNGLF